jgi:hypothetical protein
MEDSCERARDIINYYIELYNLGELHETPKIKSLSDKIKKERNQKHKISISSISDIPSSIYNTAMGRFSYNMI